MKRLNIAKAMKKTIVSLCEQLFGMTFVRLWMLLFIQLQQKLLIIFLYIWLEKLVTEGKIDDVELGFQALLLDSLFKFKVCYCNGGKFSVGVGEARKRLAWGKVLRFEEGRET